MRTAAVCPTCSTYENALCIIYNGEFLPYLDIAPGDNLEDVLVKLNAIIGALTPTTTSTSTSTTTTTTIPQFLLTWDNILNVPVADTTDVNQWNTFFNLPTNGSVFIAVNVVGNIVKLTGGGSITISDFLFQDNNNLIDVSDNSGCVITIGNSSFQRCHFLTHAKFINLTNIGDAGFDSTGLITIEMPLLTSIGNAAFDACSSLLTTNFSSLTFVDANGFVACTMLPSIDLSNVTSIGDRGLKQCYALTNINLSSCLTLGSTTGDDMVFNLITGNTITLTVPLALMSCNLGSPDGDIQYLQANNIVTIITV